ncbi:relaxase domain-containing protein [Streptomyces sp. NPDC002701]|uniref:relaxase domain-containing protein n=1 Tax=Streptomyces sp. NPDC002701 TaxID=3364661 RepID=UPI00369BC210
MSGLSPRRCAGWRMRLPRPGGRQAAAVRRRPRSLVAAFRHIDNRDGLPLLHEHCLILNLVQRLGADGDPV